MSELMPDVVVAKRLLQSYGFNPNLFHFSVGMPRKQDTVSLTISTRHRVSARYVAERAVSWLPRFERDLPRGVFGQP